MGTSCAQCATTSPVRPSVCPVVGHRRRRRRRRRCSQPLCRSRSASKFGCSSSLSVSLRHLSLPSSLSVSLLFCSQNSLLSRWIFGGFSRVLVLFCPLGPRILRRSSPSLSSLCFRSLVMCPACVCLLRRSSSDDRRCVFLLLPSFVCSVIIPHHHHHHHLQPVCKGHYIIT